MQQKEQTEQLRHRIGLAFKRLESTDAKVRQQAEEELHRLAAESPETFLFSLVLEARKLKKALRRFWIIPVGLIIWLIISGSLVGLWGRPPWLLRHLDNWAWMLAFFGSFIYNVSLKSRLRYVVHRLTEQEDMRSLGLLVELEEIKDKETQEAAEQALIPLLTRLQVNQAEMLNAHHRAILRRLLLESKNAELTLAVLKALEQVGDTHDIAPVQKLAGGAGIADNNSAIRAAAQECLEFLHERAELRRERSALLRPSSEFAPSPDLLLRPSEGYADSDPEQLLRAGASETPVGET